MKIEQKLAELGITLPDTPSNPASLILSYRRVGNVVYLSGHGPQKDGKTLYIGKLGREISVEDGCEAARITMINLLASLKKCIGDLDKVVQVVKLLGMVNSTEDFTNQPQVINAATQVLIDVFGDAGKHARSAVGMAQLPGGMSVEIEMIVEVAD